MCSQLSRWKKGIVGFMDVALHKFGGNCFWDLRCMQPGLDLSSIDDLTRKRWVKIDFWNARDKWLKLFSRAGGHGEKHWFRSEDSFKADQKAAF